jgi:hypothetical protein
MRKYLLRIGAPMLLLLGSGCETTAQEYARDAARYQALANQYAAVGDYETAAEMQRQARRARWRADQRASEEAYYEYRGQKQVPPKAMPAPSNIPGP